MRGQPFYITLPTDDAPRPQRYVLPDPEALAESAYRYGDECGREDIAAMRAMAQAYIELTAGMTQSMAIGKLRELHRALRRRRKKVQR